MIKTFIDEVIENPSVPIRDRADLNKNLPCTSVAPEDIDYFFHPTEKVGYFEGRQICSDCPVLMLCYKWAEDNKESGVWGGQLFENGKVRKTVPGGNGRGKRVRKTSEEEFSPVEIEKAA